MFRKRMLKTVALTLALSLCSLFTASVSADSPDSDNLEESYIVTYQAEEITDTQELYQLALSKSTLSAEQDPYDFTSHQLLERREYKDGHVEEDYCASNLLVLDEKGSRMSRIVPDNNVNTDSNISPWGVEAVHKMYYSYYNSNPNNPVYGEFYVKINKITTQVLNNPINATLTHSYKVQDGFGVFYNGEKKYVGKPNLGTVYTLNSTQKDYVGIGYTSGTSSRADIYSSSNGTFTLFVEPLW